MACICRTARSKTRPSLVQPQGGAPCPQAWPGAAWQPDRAGAAGETEPGAGFRNAVPEDRVPPTQGLLPPWRLAGPQGQHTRRRGETSVASGGPEGDP